jgi:hypothetical protein
VKGAPERHDGEQDVLVLFPARAGLAIASLLAASACVHDAFESPASRRTGSPAGGCARDGDGDIVCLRARTDCRAGALDCTPALVEPVAQLRGLRATGGPLDFRVGPMAGVSRRNHFQGVQRLAGDTMRFVVTRSTARPGDTDFGLVEITDVSRAGFGFAAEPRRRLSRAFETGTAWTHAGGGQIMGRIFAVPLERGAAGSAVQLYDLSTPGEPRLRALVPHQGPDGEELDQAGTASLAALADGSFLLIIGRRHANRLDFYRSTTTDIERTSWRYLDEWAESELESAIADREFGDYQNLALLPGADGALYLLGSHRHGSGPDWLDLHRVGITADRSGAPRVVVTKVARRHLRCSIEGRELCDLDAGAGAYVGADGRLRLYAISHAATPGDRPDESAMVGMMEFVSDVHTVRRR